MLEGGIVAMKKTYGLMVFLLLFSLIFSSCSTGGTQTPSPQPNVAFMTSTMGTPDLGGTSWGTDAGENRNRCR